MTRNDAAMQYKITHTTTYAYSERASTCHNQVHLAPRETATQHCLRHRVVVSPAPTDREKRLDYFGNQVEYFSVLQPHTRLTVTSTSRVEVRPAPPVDVAASAAWETVAGQLRTMRVAAFLDALQFVYGSPRIELDVQDVEHLTKTDPGEVRGMTKRFRQYAGESFGPKRPIAEAARELTSRIHTDFTFDARATTLNTPIGAAFEQRRGVCQDFAHIQIACLRSLGLAARYVSGYLRTIPPEGQPRLVGADVTHAWVSVFCGEEGWIDFDPTNDVIPRQDHVTVAWGRDYGDVCPVQGVFLGGGRQTMTTSVDVAAIESNG